MLCSVNDEYVRYTEIMHFVVRPVEAAVKDVLVGLRHALSAGRVTWLVSGGSCIEPQSQVLRELSEASLARLTIVLVDERYCESGHENSNYAALQAARFVRAGLRFEDILAGNPSFEAAAQRHSAVLKEALRTADTCIATLGIGADGHTAGILPKSPAAEATNALALGYDAPDFSRITATFAGLLEIDVAYVFAHGPKKENAVNRLKTHQESLRDLPASILYDIPSVTIYNDYIQGEERS
mgnify:CR=1 FL=1